VVTLLKLSNLEVLFLKRPAALEGEEQLDGSRGPGKMGQGSEGEGEEVVPFQFKSLTVSKNFTTEARDLLGQAVNASNQSLEAFTAYTANYFMLVNLNCPRVVLPFNILPLKYLVVIQTGHLQRHRLHREAQAARFQALGQLLRFHPEAALPVHQRL
jgi:hypothetical protein